ncbi:MAG TPA: LptE family protein [Vicinamibacterales bacterium]|nr:LptE family protein [Vicinamibacterales bacterium]
MRAPGGPGRIAILAAIAAAILTSSCGYALAGRGSFLPAYVKTIGVPTFVNRTPVFNVETMLTQKVRAEFIGRGHYTILPQDSGVDVLLLGEVTSITITPASFTTTQLASRYVITMSARIQLRDQRQNALLWENPGLIFRQEYDAGSTRSNVDPAAFFGQDQNALDRLSTEFARTIVSAILEAF